jgi:hypothetical protein
MKAESRSMGYSCRMICVVKRAMRKRGYFENDKKEGPGNVTP